MKKGAKKHILTNEDLAKRIDQTASALSRQIELVALNLVDLDGRVQKVEDFGERVSGATKSSEMRLGQKIDGLMARLDDVVLNYEKKETHQKDMQKVSRHMAALEHKVANIK
ncbi:MAG TPA: hypothetical protein VJG48_02640 [Candidatus Paceibacterota bacterium]